MTRDQQRDFARTLFITDASATQKEIAERVGVSEQTMSKWAKEEGWDKMRRSRLATRQHELANAYIQLENLNRIIMSRDEGERYPNNKEADIQVKLASQIRNLETQLSVADMMDVGMHFCEHVRQVAPEMISPILDLYDSFMKKQMGK